MQRMPTGRITISEPLTSTEESVLCHVRPTIIFCANQRLLGRKRRCWRRARMAVSPGGHRAEPRGIKTGIMGAMPMTLRLSDDEAEALRQRADLEQRSMQEVA